MVPKREYYDGYVVLHAEEPELHKGLVPAEARGNVRVERFARGEFRLLRARLCLERRGSGENDGSG